MSKAFEINFDGLVGPTHNYAGLSFGNIASMANRTRVSRPRAAALEGLAKMKFLADLGVKQAVLPPHARPHLPTLRSLEYSGSDADILAKVWREDPALLAKLSSSSSMWAANAATVSPSFDTADGRVHFTPANLVSHFHRSIEAPTTAKVLKTIFADEKFFAHHPPLPKHLPDEGAANHTRLCRSHGERGVEFFVYGRDSKKFPARQMLEASQEVARMHGVTKPIFVQQNPDAIDAGAFHNDVVAVGNENVLMYHELAWAEKLQPPFEQLHIVEVPNDQVPLADAVSTYLFNSQIVTLPNGSMALIAPVEVRENPRTREFVHGLLKQATPLREAHFVDVRQSMQNGGGPACLRLRVVLDESQIAAMHQGVLFDDALHAKLKDWIERHYREELRAQDLADPKLLIEGRYALDELTRILHLGSIYEFQN